MYPIALTGTPKLPQTLSCGNESLILYLLMLASSTNNVTPQGLRPTFAAEEPLFVLRTKLFLFEMANTRQSNDRLMIIMIGFEVLIQKRARPLAVPYVETLVGKRTHGFLSLFSVFVNYLL